MLASNATRSTVADRSWLPPFSTTDALDDLLAQSHMAIISSANPDVDNMLNALRQAAAEVSQAVMLRDVGTVQQIGNGVARLTGLPQACLDDVVRFPTGVNGLVLALGQPYLDIILLGPDEGIQGGDLVVGSGARLTVPAGPNLLGRIVNPLGQPLDEGPPIESESRRFLEQDAPRIVDRAPVAVPLHSGIKMIDALVPIGRGQRELILGDRQTGKTTLATDIILSQAGTGVKCIYVAIGQKKSSVLAVIESLRQAGALAYTTIVMASPDDPPALRYLAPYTGCTMGEALMITGQDVLIVYDDLSKHADAYRELSLLLRYSSGREAYPGDIFYLHARLLERAGRLRPAAGGGSLTALPIIQTQRGNVAAYIPTNLISITDGQIILDADRFNRGAKPAVHIGLSVSRVGGAAQSPAMRQVAGDLRLELAQYEEVAHFVRFGSQVDATTQQQIQRGLRLEELLTQPPNRPQPLAEQIVVLLAGISGKLDAIPMNQLKGFEHALISACHEQAPDTLDCINETGELTVAQRATLLTMVETVCQAWVKEMA